MPYPESTDLDTPVFGGRNTSIPPSLLPPGSSPDEQDLMFPEAAVRTRDPLVDFFAPPANVPAFNGLKTYTTPSLVDRLLAWTSLGELYRENPTGTLSPIVTGLTPNLFYDSDTLFGREYMAFGDGNSGRDFPRQYDDTNFDRVSQCGPGAPPVAANASATYIIAAATGVTQFPGIVSTLITQNGTLVTVTFGSNLPQDPSGNLLVAVGDSFTYAGDAVTNYNGTYPIIAIPAPNQLQFSLSSLGNPDSLGGTATFGVVAVRTTTAFTAGGGPTPPGLGTGFVVGKPAILAGVGVAGYDATASVRGLFTYFSAPTLRVGVYVYNAAYIGLANSVNGTIIPGGTVTVGVHQVTVAYVTRQNLITRPAPPTSYTATGTNALQLTNIPTGPSNVVARLILVTTAIAAPIPNPLGIAGQFFAIDSMMLIKDNTTTSIVLDFLDTSLAAGFNGTYLFGEIELGECYASSSYNNRTVWLGERVQTTNLLNQSFNGGWNLGGASGGGDLPLGWASAAAGAAGGQRFLNGGVWLDAYHIVGDGVTVQRGAIVQPATADFLGVPVFSAGTAYGLRVRAQNGGVPAPGASAITISLRDTGGLGVTYLSASIPVGSFTLKYTEVIVPWTVVTPGPFSSSIELFLSGDATIPLGLTVDIDSLEIFPLNIPVNGSLARISYAFNPEAIDGTTGQVQVKPNDGTQLRAAFVLRGNLYLAKERYLAYVTDDGINEPANWPPLVEVSSTIGISGPNAVDTGEEWSVFANRNGVYVFFGGDPIKISQEIQEDASGTGKICWNSINWDAATTIFVRIDNLNKRIIVGVPVNGSLTPNVIFSMDYRFIFGGEGLVAAPGAAFGAFQPSVLLEHGGGRKWSLWNIQANSCCFSERPDGTSATFFGNGVGNGKIYWQIPLDTALATAVSISDDGAPIDSYYTMAERPSAQEEQMLQFKSHRKLADYISGRARGAGTLAIVAISPYRTTPVRGISLNATPAGDFERTVNVHGERVSFQVGTDALESYFQLEKFVTMFKPEPVTPVRGLSA